MSGVNYPPLHTDWEEKLSSNKNSVIQLRLSESECKSNEIFYLQYVPIIWIYDIGNVLKVLDKPKVGINTFLWSLEIN